MISFKVRRENNKFYVYSIQHQQKLEEHKTYEKARERVDLLNQGGFQEWMPHFFTISTKEIIKQLTA